MEVGGWNGERANWNWRDGWREADGAALPSENYIKQEDAEKARN